MPVELQLVISDLCNSSCSFCAYRAPAGHSSSGYGADMGDGKGFSQNPARMIPTQKVREIVDDFVGMGGKSIIWTGGGEPTVHPDHLALLGYALDNEIECSLNTNGILLLPGWAEVLPRLAYVRVSVDAGSPEEYARIRHVPRSTYLKVLDHLTEMAPVLRASGTTLGAGYVVTPEGASTLVEGVRRLKDTGVEYVRIHPVQSTLGYAPYHGVRDQIIDAIHEAQTLQDEQYSVYDFFQSYTALTGGADNPQPTYEKCRFQQSVVYIGGDQKVYRCCSTAYTSHGLIGDLREQRFGTWLEGNEARRAYLDFDARSCGYCQWNSRNEFINALIDEPQHVNFI